MNATRLGFHADWRERGAAHATGDVEDALVDHLQCS